MNKTRMFQLVALLLTLHLMQFAQAQQQESPVDPQLEPVALQINTMGLAMHLPLSSHVGAEKVQGQTTILVSDPRSNPRWRFRLQTMIARRPGTTPASQVDDYIRSLSIGNDDPSILHNEALSIQHNGRSANAHLIYLEQKDAQDRPYVGGRLIVDSGQDAYLVASVLIARNSFDEVRGLLRTSFNTITITSVEERTEAVDERIDSARALLKQVQTTEALAPLLGKEQWTRMYQPATSKDGRPVEIGYSFASVREAKRGALTPTRPEANYRPFEHEMGLMIDVQARIVEGHSDLPLFNDIVALYWIAWDGSMEEWSVIRTRHQGDARQSVAETGVFAAASIGRPRPHLTVTSTDESGRGSPAEWDLPSTYLPQTLAHLLAHVMPRDVEQPLDCSWYFFSTAGREPRIVRRRDTWAPTNDGTGNWMLSTTLGEDGVPEIATYASDGVLVRRQSPGGVVSVPATIYELKEIWARLGIPLIETSRTTTARNTEKPDAPEEDSGKSGRRTDRTRQDR